MVRNRVVSIEDLRSLAKRRLPKMVFDFIEGAALDEYANLRNQRELASATLVQRVFRDASTIDTETTMLGKPVKVPYFISPMGMLGMFHPGADVALAQAMHERGGIFVHSAWSGVALSEVVAAAPGSTWAQVGFWRDPTYTDVHMEEARRVGVEVLVLAGDCNLNDKRERDLHHGLNRLPPLMSAGDILQAATRPGWVARFLFGGRSVTYGNYQPDGRPLRMREMKQFMRENDDPSVSWNQVRNARSRWEGRLVVKGIMNAEDAVRAVEEGADAVFVSNHGGRQFDAQPATLSVLPHIVSAVGGDVEVYCDGGIRRGSDILKMLASGATAVGLGRCAAYGLAADGYDGVERALDILRDELVTSMGFTGAMAVGDIGPSVLSEFRDRM